MFMRILAILALTLCGLVQAQALNNTQRATLCTACKGAAACNTPRQIGDATAVAGWLNAARTPTTLAWVTNASGMLLDSGATYSTFDTLSAGKRDAWALFLQYAPRDMTRAKNRNTVTDVWGSATAGSVAEAILQAATFSATNAQNALGGTTRTTGTVSALDLTWPYVVSQDDANWVANPVTCN